MSVWVSALKEDFRTQKDLVLESQAHVGVICMTSELNDGPQRCLHYNLQKPGIWNLKKKIDGCSV